ncbi:IS66 family transposase, partial [Nocardia sp. CWNU-33]|uniref:IS66 family transposase n=1 Tax=Nocardia sp. CWNU-33 TaxID=3392117 RepID=UPI00398F3400
MKSPNALARRLLARQDDYLRFTTNLAIPPDNNGSERDIRMIKLGTAARIGDNRVGLPLGQAERMSSCPSPIPASSATMSCASPAT